MDYPSIEQTHQLLEEAEAISPGPWIKHSYLVGQAARLIAERHYALDQSIAYVLGCLHDIGRRDGATSMRHVLVGYHIMIGYGYPTAARISITHAFPVKDIYAVHGEWDCSQAEMEFVQQYLNQITYDDYDRLIQLCDAVSLTSGYSLIEKRLVDISLRRGLSERILPRWKAYMQLKEGFENEIGCSIYALLPGVVENTFGDLRKTELSSS